MTEGRLLQLSDGERIRRLRAEGREKYRRIVERSRGACRPEGCPEALALGTAEGPATTDVGHVALEVLR